jgi:hypothetical protein
VDNLGDKREFRNPYNGQLVFGALEILARDKPLSNL